MGIVGDGDQRYGIELCRRGYVVLCPNRFGFESWSSAASGFDATFAGFRIFTDGGLELTENP